MKMLRKKKVKATKKYSAEFIFENSKETIKAIYTNKYISMYLSSIGKTRSILCYDDLDKWFYSIIKNYRSENFPSEDFSKQDEKENLTALKDCAVRFRDGYRISVNIY